MSIIPADENHSIGHSTNVNDNNLSENDSFDWPETYCPIPLEILKSMRPTPAQKAAPGLDNFEEWMRSHEQEEGSVGPAELS